MPPNTGLPPRSAGLRILVVEDESVIAMLLEDILTQFGHQVVGPVARLGKAVELARHEALDTAILDVNMNGEEVYPVAEALAEREIPFVFASGYGKSSLRNPFADCPVLTKPFQWRDLRAILTRVEQTKMAAKEIHGPDSRPEKRTRRSASRTRRRRS
jgi:CheY-like chemotaxis protein